MRAFLAAMFVVALGVLAGCAAPTRLNAQWTNPQFDGKPPLGKLLVMSITPDGTTRRVFEDMMVKELEARGIAAVPSYRFLAADGPATPSQVEAAVKESGAQSILTSRVISATQNIHVAPSVAMGPAWGGPWGWPWGWGGGFYGSYGGLWGGSFAAPQVWTDENVIVDTQFFDVGTQAIVWSGSTMTTTAPGAQGTVQILQQFAQVIADAMAAAKLI
ncbi:MAG: hypothetical protein ABI633_03345 [Burkholderiales bacterium]